MNIKSRLKKMESQLIKEDEIEGFWDYSRLTTEQLDNLITLHESDDKAEASKYVRQLADEGLLYVSKMKVKL